MSPPLQLRPANRNALQAVIHCYLESRNQAKTYPDVPVVLRIHTWSKAVSHSEMLN